MIRPPILDPARLAGTPRVTEAQLSKQVKDFLEIDGWRVFRMEPLSNVIQKRYSAELGCPDLLALRYGGKRLVSVIYHAKNEGDILWLEIKRRGKKPAKHQAEWHAKERALGAEVWVCDDFDEFRSKYCKSGLNRSIRA